MDTTKTGWAIVWAATGKAYLGRVVGQHLLGELLYVDVEDALLYASQMLIAKDGSGHVKIERNVVPIDMMPSLTKVWTRCESIWWFEGGDENEELIGLLQIAGKYRKQIEIHKSGLIFPGN